MSHKLRRFIAWWQIASGALGYLAFALPAIDWPRGARRILIDFTGPYVVVAGVIFFSLCIVFGVRLLRGERRGFFGSAACQAAQSVSFAFLHGPHVLIQAGPKIALTVASDGFNVGIGFNSAFFLGTRIAGPAWEVTVNVLAVVWTVMLLREGRRSPERPAEARSGEALASGGRG